MAFQVREFIGSKVFRALIYYYQQFWTNMTLNHSLPLAKARQHTCQEREESWCPSSLLSPSAVNHLCSSMQLYPLLHFWWRPGERGGRLCDSLVTF